MASATVRVLGLCCTGVHRLLKDLKIVRASQPWGGRQNKHRQREISRQKPQAGELTCLYPGHSDLALF